jgi:secreted trypsin-like serine protease
MLPAVSSVALLGLVLVCSTALAVGAHEPAAHASIVGGTPAEDGSFPSAAFILDSRGKQLGLCTGTVVAPSLVLTAGHCAEDVKTGSINAASGYRVATGEVDWATGTPQVSTVLGVIPYPGFAPRVAAGDAALLVLSAPVSAPPMALAGSSQTGLSGAGATATIAGWGKTSFEDKSLTERLNFASTVLQPAKWCERNARPFFPKWELCTVDSASFSTGGCNGDSGGPLLVSGSTEGESVEIGIISHGYGACSTRRPSVYTRVDALSGWLSSWIAAYRTPVLSPTPVPAPSGGGA